MYQPVNRLFVSKSLNILVHKCEKVKQFCVAKSFSHKHINVGLLTKCKEETTYFQIR